MKQAELKANERELVKLIQFFEKRAARMMETGEISEEHNQLIVACQNLQTQLFNHAQNRSAILDKRDRLQQLIEDNAKCPTCQKADMLKRTGAATNESGWKCNTYKCRRCNIAFTWNKPNNPWDMVRFLETYIQQLEQAILVEENQDLKAHTEDAIIQLNDSLSRLRPVLDTSDEELAALEEKEREMGRLIHQFKNYLLIEKIKMDTYQEPE